MIGLGAGAAALAIMLVAGYPAASTAQDLPDPQQTVERAMPDTDLPDTDPVLPDTGDLPDTDPVLPDTGDLPDTDPVLPDTGNQLNFGGVRRHRANRSRR